MCYAAVVALLRVVVLLWEWSVGESETVLID